MSLQALQSLRRDGLRPSHVSVVAWECPVDRWAWWREDPAIVWLPARQDLRAHDLRALVGINVDVFVDDIDSRRDQVKAAIYRSGAKLAGVTDGRAAFVSKRHEWAAHADASPWWEEAAKAWLLSQWNLMAGV